MTTRKTKRNNFFFFQMVTVKKKKSLFYLKFDARIKLPKLYIESLREVQEGKKKATGIISHNLKDENC